MSTSQIVLLVMFAIVMIALGWLIGYYCGAEMMSKIYHKDERQEYGPSLIDKDVIRVTRDLIAGEDHILRVVGEHSAAEIEAFEARWNEIISRPSDHSIGYKFMPADEFGEDGLYKEQRDQICRAFGVPENILHDKNADDKEELPY